MGHIRLGILPKHHRWQELIRYLDDPDISTSDVAGKVIDNSKDILARDSVQSVLGYCVWFLAQLTLAARKRDLETTLAQLGLQVTQSTSAAEFLAQVSEVTSCHISAVAPYTALNTMAGLSLREALTRTVGIQATTLFGAGLLDVQLALKKYSTQKQFASLLHFFFTAFLRRTLQFVIEKEIANHLGPDRRLTDVNDLADFDAALEVFASQTSRIVDEFSGGWYSKRAWQQGDISQPDATQFVHIALQKLQSDLELSGVRDA